MTGYSSRARIPLTGVFSGSLPGSWGRLLTDRIIQRNGGSPREYGPLERLSLVGSTGAGALSYKPDMRPEEKAELTDLNRISDACRQVLRQDGTDPDCLQELFGLGGSSGAQGPKSWPQSMGRTGSSSFPR